MNWFTGFVAFVVIWWVVLFTVLPFGVRTPDEAQVEPEPGQARSAPVRPRIAVKFLVTTLIAGVLWAGFYYVATTDLLDFRAFLRR
jgi:predicted secreted protein